MELLECLATAFRPAAGFFVTGGDESALDSESDSLRMLKSRLKIQIIAASCVTHLELDDPLDSVAVDDSELLTTGGFSTTGFCFGGRPFGLGGGLALAGGAFFLGSSSLSVELSGEKMLFIFDLLAAAAAIFAVFAFALDGADFMLPLPCNCCCCCLTTEGGALPPTDGALAAAEAFFALLFDADAKVFFLISFCTRFASVCWALVGGVSSSSVE